MVVSRVKIGCEMGFFFLTGPGTVGLNTLMKISLVLVNFSLARPNFHWPRAPGQLLRSQMESEIAVNLIPTTTLGVLPKSTKSDPTRLAPRNFRFEIRGEKYYF